MSEFLLKPRICFGQDALSVLNELSARSVLLVTDQAMVKFGLAERVTALLRQRGIAWQVWTTWWPIRISPPWCAA
ncbi:iron-containing alcohol dehydrogenase [Klebsiella variicola]|uniref:Iron-containing alcohol dehydrogenase n=1 Tax=Klebsiella variicola TaxID=244366 RepID=A0A7H4MCM2_KLEVA|nr:iron-containing alcohol dehydrogenase [Klebsiella variicola]